MSVQKRSVMDRDILIPALLASVKKLDPRHMIGNPVMFVTEVGAVVTTCEIFRASSHGESVGFVIQICLWLWFTVIFANFAEALAEGRGKAQADALRRSRTKTFGNRETKKGALERVAAEVLRKGDIVVVVANEVIPADGEIIEGAATIDEAVITGESAPVIRESGGDRSAVTGGTTVLSDSIRIRVGADPGQSFLDRMIALIEGAKRQKTPNEIALNILLSALTIIFVLVCVALRPFSAIRLACRNPRFR
jgi:K+-transporting ATPase ATPase B chain